MKKQEFLRTLIAGITGVVGVSFLAGCMAPRVSQSAWDKMAGDPYRCGRCGHLTRSKKDISGERCPRCHSKMLTRITEEKMVKYLKDEAPIR